MPSLKPPLKKKGVTSGGAPPSPLARGKKGKTPETPPSSNTRSRGGAAKKQNEELSTARSAAAAKPGKNAIKKRKTHLKTMHAVQEEGEDGELLSPPSRKKTSSSTVAASADTFIFAPQYEEAQAGKELEAWASRAMTVKKKPRVCKYGCTCFKCADKNDIGAAELAACRQDGLSLDYRASAGILLPGQILRPPTIAAAAGTSAYLNAYGDAAEAPVPRLAGAAVQLEEEFDVMDGIVVLSRKGAIVVHPASNDADPEPEEAMVDGVEPALDDSDDSKSDADFSLAEGLEFTDDEDVLDLHIDSDDEMRSSFPKDTRPKNMIIGGPQRPDPTGPSEEEYQKQLNKFVRRLQ